MWIGLVVLVLLPFPFLAAAIAFGNRSLRKRMAERQNTIDELSWQAKALEAAALNSAAHLQDARAAHDRLTREFHHRVKNSLQIIQSYLTLSRRQRPELQNNHLAEADVKVQVISSAYRLALGDGTMSPIPIRVFVLDIVENAQAILCGSAKTIRALVVTEARLPIDRAIPLGLAIIETITAALGSTGVMHVDLRLQAKEMDELTLVVTIDDIFAEVALPSRLMSGLQSQLEAYVEPRTPGAILSWRFSI